MADARVRISRGRTTKPQTVRHAVDALVKKSSNRTEINKQTRRLRVLPAIDGRGAVARKYRDLCLAIISDQGGPERMTEVRLQLVRRFAASSVLAEVLEAAMANGEQIDIGQHALLTSSLVRLASRIGLDRKAKNVTPDLRDYLAHKTKRNGEIIDHEERADD